MARRFRPFTSLPNPREVFAWAMYDLANQSFTLLMITLLFPIYFKDVIVGQVAPVASGAAMTGTGRGDSLWSIAGGVSLFIVVLASPFVGAAADAYGLKKRLLMTTGAFCALLTIGLSFMGPNQVVFAMVAFMLANIAYQLGENLLAGFLPEISTPRNIGRVSATGWAFGYAGALVLQIVIVVAMLALGLKDTSKWPVFFVLAGVWFLLGMMPPALWLHETKPRHASSGRNLISATLARTAETVRRATEYRQLARFLIAFFVYALGVQAIIYFAGVIAKDFGMGDVKLMMFALQLSVTAGIGAIATGLYQDKIGAKTTVFVFLGVWIVTAIGLLALSLIPNDLREANQWAFWVVGNGVGLGLGGIGTASRSMVGLFTPKQRTAEFFGLWGMTYKMAGAIGVLSFGQVRAQLGDSKSMMLLLGFFVAGMLLLLRVNSAAGMRAARRAERRESHAESA